MKRIFSILFIVLCTVSLQAQPVVYSTANAHSHNNYEQPVPFRDAYKQQYGSIEADVFLSADSNDLWVAHSPRDLEVKKISLDSLYLRPLADCIKKNKGYIYTDHARRLQLMIDIKSSAEPALAQLVKMIMKYPGLANNPSIRFVISGNRPSAAQFTSYPSFVWFDGLVNTNYTTEALSRIAMISAPLTQYTKWNGTGAMLREDEKKLQQVIEAAHDQKKPIRFWAAPDNAEAWKVLMILKVDFINTDKVNELAEYFAKRTKE
jgi:alkaline phosphatase